tara:strand:+ start:349 stop:810 length:462 start_codon:yes stop_codon:yes gene_type:complete
MKKFNEKYLRSLAKVVTMRIIFTFVHIINTFIVTGSLIAGLKVAGLAFFINPILYWLHERGWNWWQWGRYTDDIRKFKEGNWRSLGKDITWRVVITGSNFFLPYFVTGSLKYGLTIMSLATLVNMTIYFCHERVWNLFKWGRESLYVSNKNVD